jgi:hypothetical protein
MGGECGVEEVLSEQRELETDRGIHSGFHSFIHSSMWRLDPDGIAHNSPAQRVGLGRDVPMGQEGGMTNHAAKAKGRTVVGGTCESWIGDFENRVKRA